MPEFRVKHVFGGWRGLRCVATSLGVLAVPAFAQANEARQCFDTYSDALSVCAAQASLDPVLDRQCRTRADAAFNLCMGLEGDAPRFVLTVDPAEVSVIEFEDFEEPNGETPQPALPAAFANGTVVMRDTGQPGSLKRGEPEARLGKGSLVIATPFPENTQNTYDGIYALTLIAPSGETAELEVRTDNNVVGIYVVDERHFIEEDDPEPFVPLILEGIDKVGLLTGEPLVVGIEGAEGPIRNRQDTGIPPVSIFMGGNRKRSVDVTDLFAYDADLNALVSEPGAIEQILSQSDVGANVLYFRLNYKGVREYLELTFVKPTTLLSGQLVDNAGEPVSGAGLETLEILVEGANTRLRHVVDVDAQGRFEVPDLPWGETWKLTVTDLRYPNLFQQFAAVFEGSTRADVELRYDPTVFGGTFPETVSASEALPVP